MENDVKNGVLYGIMTSLYFVMILFPFGPWSFRSYSLLDRSFRPGSFRPDFRGGSFRPSFSGSFRPTLFYSVSVGNTKLSGQADLFYPIFID